jgi:hypothetical protein
MERDPVKTSRIRLALAVRFFLTGPELREHGERGMERKAGTSRALMKSLGRVDSGILGRGSWAVTISARFGGHGRIIAGRAADQAGAREHTGDVDSLR